MGTDIAIIATESTPTSVNPACSPHGRTPDGDPIVGDVVSSRVLWSLPEIMWVARPDGYVLFVNDAGLKYLGNTFDKVGGWAWLQFVHPADRERAMHTWIETTMEGRNLEISYRVLMANGEYHLNLVRAQPVHDETGAITSYVGSHTDLENLVQTREALSSANLQIDGMEAILAIYEQHCPAAMACVDESLRIVRVNARFCEMAGCHSLAQAGKSLEEVLGRDGRVVALAAAEARDTMRPQMAMEFTKEEYSPRRRVRNWRLSLYPTADTDGVSVVLIASER